MRFNAQRGFDGVHIVAVLRFYFKALIPEVVDPFGAATAGRRFAHSDQGIGITLLGTVIDRKRLGALALTISGGLITLVTVLLAFSESVSRNPATHNVDRCALSVEQESALSAMIKTFDLNSSCAYNQTIGFVALNV